MPQISVLMVGYHSQDFLPSCLATLETASAGYSCEILFIDNGDRQGEALVKQLCPAAHIVPGQGNIGFAAANNLLGRQARGHWLLLLNPDTEIEREAVGALIEAAQAHPEFGILGGMTVIDRNSDSLLPPLEPPGPALALRSLLGIARKPWKFAADGSVTSVAATSGGFMLVERALWQQLKGFDERFFLYGEDIDLCTRARRLGSGVGLVPQARAFHAVGSGFVYSPKRLTFQMRGNATYIRKHYSGPAALSVLALWWAAVCTRALGACMLQAVSKRYQPMARGYLALAIRPQSWLKGYKCTSNDVEQGDDRRI